SDMPARLKWTDEQKIERQVVGSWLDMFAYEVPAEEGATWSRLINTHLAQTALRQPRIEPLATAPLQDGRPAAEVLRNPHAAGIGGAALPYVIGRLRRNYSLDKDKLGDPDAALAAMYYDTIVQDPRALRYLADIVGAERIMMGSDMPFPIGDLAPLKIVTETKFSDAERAAINGGLAQRLFGL